MEWNSRLAALILATVCTFAFGSEQAAGLYGRKIIVEGPPDKMVQESADELALWLNKATGATFEISPAPADTNASAIYLLKSDSKLAPPADAERLKDKGFEAFVLRSDANSKLWIIGNSPMALRNGVFFYLDQLGCRWFFPNEHWNIIPSLKSIALNIDRIESPAFRCRDLAGTGGFGGSLTIDPERKLQARWYKWQDRNLLGGEIQLSGHTGEAFNVKYKDVLEAHPEYLAEINGKREPWTEITKLCTSNPDLRKLYVDDQIRLFKESYEYDPNSRSAWGRSVEPADGGGHCECSECRKIGSVSDRVFFMANEAAKEMTRQFPGKKVSLLAYHKHAAVPSIDIEPNVLVWVTPYGFNQTGLPGDELLKAWAKKSGELGLYDYWVIPDWSNCLPDLSYLTTVPRKIRFWHENSVRAFNAESTYSAGNAGVVWIVASRLLWNPDADVSAVVEDFYTKSFGPAAPPMKRMLERWCSYDNTFLLREHELGLSFRDIAEARKLAPDDATRKRIDDFALYVQYLRLWYDYQIKPKFEVTQDEPKRLEAKKKAADALVEFCWRIYDSAMVHSYRMHELIKWRYEADAPRFDAQWPLYEKAPAWDNLKPVTTEEIEQYVADGVRTFKPAEFKLRDYSENLVPLLKPTRPRADVTWTPRMYGDVECRFWAADGVREIKMEFVSGYTPTADSKAPNDVITVIGPDGKTVLNQTMESDGVWRTIAIPTPGQGLYRMTVFDQKAFFYMKVPVNLPFVIAGGFVSVDLAPRMYFLVPKGLDRLAIDAEGVIPFDLMDGSSIPAPGENPDVWADKTIKVNGFIVKDVPPQLRGTLWSFRGFKSDSRLRAINVPAYFALSPEGMLVPAEVRN